MGSFAIRVNPNVSYCNVFYTSLFPFFAGQSPHPPTILYRGPGGNKMEQDILERMLHNVLILLHLQSDDLLQNLTYFHFMVCLLYEALLISMK